jgi:hypothetical protein
MNFRISEDNFPFVFAPELLEDEKLMNIDGIRPIMLEVLEAEKKGIIMNLLHNAFNIKMSRKIWAVDPVEIDEKDDDATKEEKQKKLQAREEQEKTFAEMMTRSKEHLDKILPLFDRD